MDLDGTALMETYLPMEEHPLKTDNQTLSFWIYELMDAQQAGSARDWVKCFDKICRHFMPFVREEQFQNYVLHNFPIDSIVNGFWSDSSAHLSSFFSNSFVAYDENFHIDFVTKYPDLIWTMKKLPYVEENMPALNSVLVLMG